MAPKDNNIRFCSECNNMLYPKADDPRKVLLYACRNCPYTEETENPRVFRHDLKMAVREEAGVTQDITADPALPRQAIQCPRCRHNEAVFYQDQGKRHEAKMTLFYVCTKCNKTFRDPILMQGQQFQNMDESQENEDEDGEGI